MSRVAGLFVGLLLLSACGGEQVSSQPQPNAYLDYSGRDDLLAGGVRLIPIETPKGVFRVWTKRIGNNPTAKVLLLHGGPGFSHEYLEAFDSYLPGAGIEYYYYDQLGSAYSDKPEDPELWELPRFVEEVEQVRKALGLDASNFYLYGQSWGGILAMEYALKYQQNLKGLVISNMMSSIPAYNEYAKDRTDASHGPGGAEADPGDGGRGGFCQPALRGTADGQLLRGSHPAHAT